MIPEGVRSHLAAHQAKLQAERAELVKARNQLLAGLKNIDDRASELSDSIVAIDRILAIPEAK